MNKDGEGSIGDLEVHALFSHFMTCGISCIRSLHFHTLAGIERNVKLNLERKYLSVAETRVGGPTWAAALRSTILADAPGRAMEPARGLTLSTHSLPEKTDMPASA